MKESLRLQESRCLLRTGIGVGSATSRLLRAGLLWLLDRFRRFLEQVRVSCPRQEECHAGKTARVTSDRRTELGMTLMW